MDVIGLFIKLLLSGKIFFFSFDEKVCLVAENMKVSSRNPEITVSNQCPRITSKFKHRQCWILRGHLQG